MALDKEQINPDELKADLTEGYKVSEILSVDQYKNLDAEDESLVRWKKSLGIDDSEDISDPNDKRTVIIKALAFMPEGRDETVFDLTTTEGLEALSSKPFTIKAGSTFQLRVTFQVQHEIMSGLKYIQVAKRLGISNKVQQMIGSYGPNTKKTPLHSMTFDPETVPDNRIFRGIYKVVSRFVDDDSQSHLQFDWSFEIKKEWD